MKNWGQYCRLLLPALIILVVSGLARAAWAVTPQLCTGVTHTVHLRSDGTIWTSGSNAAGQLGDGTTVSRTVPVQVGLLSNATNWIAIAAGEDHTLALKADGSMWAWGANQAGQIGDGTISGVVSEKYVWANKIAPVSIGASGVWTAIAAGGSSSFALKADGSLWGWGNKPGTAQLATLPEQIGTDKNWKAISVGEFHVLALKADGTLWAWGENSKGQLGDRTTTNRQAPVQIGLPDKTVIPNIPDNSSNWVSITAGGSSSYALKADGTLWAWGQSDYGQLGIGVTDTAAHKLPVKITTEQDWANLSAGNLHVLAVKQNGSIWAWGDNTSGQLGDGTMTSRDIPQQISFPTGLTEIVTVAAGAFHSVALKANGDLYAWGDNGFGQLGNGSELGSPSALLVGTDEIGWVATEPGGEFTVARRSNGTLWTWGDNSKGQLGDNTLTQRTTPIMVGTATNWVAQATGWSHTVALQADGTLWTWGGNSKGQLGDGTTANRQIPTRIGAVNNWRAVAAGDFHTLALKTDGSIWAWGDNNRGQLGDGTGIKRTLPVQIKTGYPGNFDKRWVAIAAGGSHSLALQADGTIWAWGDNSKKQHGNPDFGLSINTPRQVAIRSNPPTIGFNSNWVAIATGLNHSLALQADGTLWAWGDNFSGQLGDNSATLRNAPVQVGLPDNTVTPHIPDNSSNWISIAAGDTYSFARKADGTLWTWGNNTKGQMGNGVTDPHQFAPAPNKSPIQLTANAGNWVAATGGGSHLVALRSDGTLWGWGNNTKGELGDGTTTNKSIPAPLVETHIEAAPTAVAFGTLAIGAPSSQTITISNSGTAKLNVTGVTISGTGYSVASGTCDITRQIAVNAGRSCTVNVTFNPTSAGVNNGMLTIVSSDPLFPTQTVNLSGTAVMPLSVATSVTPAGSGTISPNGTNGTVYVIPGSGQVFSITPSTGFHVVDVKVDGASKGAVSSLILPPVTANATISATFAVNNYAVTSTAGPNGTITGLPTTPAKHGDMPTCTITPKPGYHVVDVTVNGKSAGAVTSLKLPALLGDTEVAAEFAINTYNVTVTSGANGSITGPAMAKHGDSPVYSITPNSGYHVVDVFVDGVSKGVATSMTLPAISANKSISALFAANYYTISASADARGTITPSGNLSVLHGANQTFTFKPIAGYNVVNVLVDGVSKGSLTTYTFAKVASDNHTLKVVFIPDGDLDNDGKVDINDSIKALKISVGLIAPTATNILHGDTAPLDAGGIPVPDRKISVADALQILRKAVGITSGW